MTAPSLVSTNGFINTANNISANRYQGPQPLPSSNIYHNIPVSQKPLCTTGLTSFSGSQGGNGLLNSSVILVPTLQTDGTVSYSLQTQVKLSSPIKPCPILPMLSLPHQEKTGEFTVAVKPRQHALILPKFPQPSGTSEMMPTLQSKITPNRIQIDSKLGLLDNISGSLSQMKRENDIPSGIFYTKGMNSLNTLSRRLLIFRYKITFIRCGFKRTGVNRIWHSFDKGLNGKVRFRLN